FRGVLRKVRASELTADDMARFHLIAFGDPSMNSVIADAVASWDDLQWDKRQLAFAGHDLSAANHLPAMIRPNPESPQRYLVINSGPTFREGHDRTNSLQNPKLPDWALIDLDHPPSDVAPGGIVAAGFFGEKWELE
ncbi:MAG: prolyl oligopeptidase family serine peptidase, partial [Verrucomicrobiales bacterium]